LVFKLVYLIIVKKINNTNRILECGENSAPLIISWILEIKIPRQQRFYKKFENLQDSQISFLQEILSLVENYRSRSPQLCKPNVRRHFFGAKGKLKQSRKIFVCIINWYICMNRNNWKYIDFGEYYGNFYKRTNCNRKI
jgi:hypothetical protein